MHLVTLLGKPANHSVDTLSQQCPRRWFAPTLRWLASRSWHLPRQQLKELRLAARSVREAIFSFHHVLEDGFDAALLQARRRPRGNVIPSHHPLLTFEVTSVCEPAGYYNRWSLHTGHRAAVA